MPNSGYMGRMLNPPTLSQISAAGRLHQRLEQWRLSDSALQRLHKSLPEFDFESCLLKSLAINVLYGTQVLAIIPMSQHVKDVLSNIDIDASGAELVDEIANFTHKGKHRRFISFASKFCHFFVSENRFPLYDEAVREVLKMHLGAEYIKGEHKPYMAFCENLQKLRDAANFHGPVRDMDRYLWIVGMYMRWQKERIKEKPIINAELNRLFQAPAQDQQAELKAVLPKLLGQSL